LPKIFDNIENQFAIGLSEHLTNAKRVDYCVGYFNLRGWGVVCDGINNLQGEIVNESGKKITIYCRLLIGMTKTPQQELLENFTDPEALKLDNVMANQYRKKLAADFSEQLTYGFPTHGDELILQKLLKQLKTGRVVVKLFLQHQLHAKLYLAHSDGNITPVISLLGSSNFTLSGLKNQGELNVDVLEQDAASKLDKWFTSRWLDNWCIDITKDLINIFEQSWARSELIPPYLIYLKIAYHLSREARTGVAEYTLSSEFSKELVEFQQAAVKIAAHHLHSRRGVMIGDVVGLGKTIMATAVVKIMEDELYYNTLITCPKNLVQMWEGYKERYSLHAKIVSHSMLRQVLPDLKRYKLVLIDESHNFRNNQGQTYRALKSYIDENESRVILLSATPYNKSYIDLANQLKLFLPVDYDLGIIPERYIDSLGGLVHFSSVHADTNVRSINAFEKSNFVDDWREIMRLFLVRRTRSFIKANYAKTDIISGKKYLEFSSGEKSYFPDRLPKKVEFSLDCGDPVDQYAALYQTSVVDAINALNLPRYGLQRYINSQTPAQPTNDEIKILKNLSKAGTSIIGFCRTNLFKRLESSGFAFLLSLFRHIQRNYIFLYALKENLDLPVSGQSNIVDCYSDDDDDDDDDVSYSGLKMNFNFTDSDYKNKAQDLYSQIHKEYKNSYQWIRSTLFNTKALIHDLEIDTKCLSDVLSRTSVWKPENDRKLEALYTLLTKIHNTEKAIIFTQYADTAIYIFEQLKLRGIDNAALAVGGCANIAEIVKRFSPDSNGSPTISKDDQIRVLISTDVLSEGQNLQDAHIVINYDLPWAIVRLTQRAGRIDRLGQKSSKILCYSFLPEEGIERIIGLREKLKLRICENAEVVGSDEVFFDGDPINISDLYNEKSGILEDEETEVDLASLAYQIWKNGIDTYPDVKAKVEKMPNVVFSAKANDTSHEGDGVIVYASTKDNNDALAWLDSNGNIVTQSQYTILKAASCEYSTAALPKLPTHHEIIVKCLSQIDKETTILSRTVSGVLGKKKSIKYRTFMRLSNFFENNRLIVDERLKYAIDTINRYPLQDNAIDTLSRHLHLGISDDLLSNLVMSLFDSNRLCVIKDNNQDHKNINIICSMSLIGGVN
jgi:superfamily II DNA or RNA helicase